MVQEQVYKLLLVLLIPEKDSKNISAILLPNTTSQICTPEGFIPMIA